MTVTHQRNQVHLASPQDTGMYEAKAMKSAQHGRIHQTLPLWQVPVCPHPGHGTAPCGSQQGNQSVGCGGGAADFYDNLLWQSHQPLVRLTAPLERRPLGHLTWAGKVKKTSQALLPSLHSVSWYTPRDFIAELCLWTNSTSPYTYFPFRVFGLVDSLPFTLWKLLKDCLISWLFKRQYTFRAVIYQSIWSFSLFLKDV